MHFTRQISRWVNAPFGEHYFQAAAVSKDLKLASGIRTWNWRGHSSPEPVLEADRQGTPVGIARGFVRWQMSRSIRQDQAGNTLQYRTTTAGAPHLQGEGHGWQH